MGGRYKIIIYVVEIYMEEENLFGVLFVLVYNLLIELKINFFLDNLLM